MIIAEFKIYTRTYCRGIYRYQLQERVCCPDCGRRLYAHGTCVRKICREIDGCMIVEKLCLQVMECRLCRKTHRVLPEDIAPYKRYDVRECAERCKDRKRAGDIAFFRLIAWLSAVLACTEADLRSVVKRLEVHKLVEIIKTGIGGRVNAGKHKVSIYT